MANEMTPEHKAHLAQFERRLSNLEQEFEEFAASFNDNSHPLWQIWQSISTADARLSAYIVEAK